VVHLYIIFFAGLVTLTELTGSAVATHEAKFIASVKITCRYFLTTNQLFCFGFDIDKVIRQTYTHTCMHTNMHTEIYMHSCIGLHA